MITADSIERLAMYLEDCAALGDSGAAARCAERLFQADSYQGAGCVLGGMAMAAADRARAIGHRLAGDLHLACAFERSSGSQINLSKRHLLVNSYAQPRTLVGRQRGRWVGGAS